MTDRTCAFSDRRDDVLIAYLYDELEPADRGAFATHLLQCTTCRDEVAALKAVRRELAAWTPPQPEFDRERRSTFADGRPGGRWWHQVPVWAQVAAAMLVLGVSAGVANLNVHYDQSGLTIRTGWKPAVVAGGESRQVPAGARVAPASAGTSVAAPTAASTPWRGDLAALEQQLRTEFHAAQVVAPARAGQADTETLRRVRALVEDSERKQQRELALRVAEVIRDVENERRADLVRIEQTIGQVQNNTGVEVMKQRQLLNYLVRVSSQK
jgi:anti-sigma factor RsiW